MRWRRAAFLLLAAALLTGGRAICVRVSHDGGPVAAKIPAELKTVEPARRLAMARRGIESGAPARRVEGIAAAQPAELNADESALLGETCELQLLARGSGLAIDSKQWSELAAVALDTDAIRQTYEAEIATAVAEAPGKFRVEIPSYASAGEALRAKFYAQLDRVLGTAAAADVADRIGARLEARFGGFGISEQTLEITGDPRTDLADCVVKRTVTYTTQGEQGDRVATRRETFLPAWEDPAGDRWGTLLARAAM